MILDYRIYQSSAFFQNSIYRVLTLKNSCPSCLIYPCTWPQILSNPRIHVHLIGKEINLCTEIFRDISLMDIFSKMKFPKTKNVYVFFSHRLQKLQSFNIYPCPCYTLSIKKCIDTITYRNPCHRTRVILTSVFIL